jgi:tRNA(Ile)-lysidine synthetase-like protein
VADVFKQLAEAIARVPPGAWAVGVSGGADSVALLSLLRARTDLSLHVVHLDHQTRGAESDADARFVADLARQWRLPCTVARRDELEPSLPDPPANLSARYRAVRLALFRRVIDSHNLSGVILAHHALDQAETVLQRLIRGGGYTGLAGMSPRAVVRGVTILRPLLAVEQPLLPEYLRSQGLTWRTDASNESDQYLRNRLRKVLKRNAELQGALIELARSCRELRDWARQVAPVLPGRFPCSTLARLPRIIAHGSARLWLTEQGVPLNALSWDVVHRLIDMSRDAASPPKQDFPGPLRVRRRGSTIFADQG